jgi:hypothetical protein
MFSKGADLPEDLAMGAGDLVKVPEVGDENTGADYVIETAAGLDQGGSDDLQGPPRLGIGARGRGAVRVPAHRRPHEDLIAYANRPGVPLPKGAG